MASHPPLAWWYFRPSFLADQSRLWVCEEDPTHPLWLLSDVLHALRINSNLVDLSEVVEFVAEHEDENGLQEFIPTNIVLQLSQDRPDFQDRISYITGAIAARALHQDRPARAQSLEVVDIEDVRGSSYSLLLAARILSRDPQLSFGRESLFKSLKQLGWVDKELSVHIPAPAAVKAGWLVRNRVWDRNSSVAYNQVRVTRAGLHELHSRLGGVSRLDLDAPATPSLLEV